MDRKIYKSGNSLVVVVPSDFVDVIGIKNGDTVRVVSDYAKGVVRYTFSGTKQMTLANSMQTRKHR